MFIPIVTFPIDEIEPECVAWRGPWFGDALEESAGQAAVLQGEHGAIPGYFSGSSFVSRADLACADVKAASERAERFTRQMCGISESKFEVDSAATSCSHAGGETWG